MAQCTPGNHEKKAGDNCLFRLRRINHYEADYNLLLKYFWAKQASQREEETDTMGTNQYGERKHLRYSDVAFINEIILEFHRIIHIPITITQHDNAACFDRTVLNITTLVNRKFNIPQDVCKLVTNIKENMRYHVVTHYGKSSRFYGHSTSNSVHGSGQGSGNTGMEWNFLSIPAMTMMKKNTEGCIIKGPTGNM